MALEPLFKVVDGEHIELTKEEAAQVRAEWKRNKPPTAKQLKRDALKRAVDETLTIVEVLIWELNQIRIAQGLPERTLAEVLKDAAKRV